MADKRITQQEAARQMSAADKRIKGISSIASSTINRTRDLELKKSYGTAKGNKQAVSSVDKALRSLTLSTEALARGVKQITVETARGVKSITAGGAQAMSEYAKAITSDININRQSFMVTTIGRFTPMVGYAVAKMMETAVFRNMIEKMKMGLGRALNSVSSKFKQLALAGWQKGKDAVNYVLDIGSNKRGAVKTRMAKARAAKKEKRYYTQESAIKAALADAKVSNLIQEKAKNKKIESQVPHMATGGYVKKEGLAKVHAAEVVQPVDKITETIVKIVNERLDKKEKRPESKNELVSFFKKGKKEDLFGMEKVTDKMTTLFDVMTRKSLRLETRILRRDKANQRGLIKSFMSAYTEEAKQEELPLMERQVRATLELKKTISGENKTLSAALSKMFYEHPIFFAMHLGMKGLYKTISLPTKFLFKRRGVYANDLATSGTVFERLLDANSQLYSGVLTKLDDIIANTYVAANAGIQAASSGGTLSKADTRKAPGQRGWSFAGIIGKALYATHVKAPAMIAEWLAGKSGMSDKWKDRLFKKRTIKGEALKLFEKWKSNAEYNADRIGDSLKRRGGQASSWVKNKINYSDYGQRRAANKARQQIKNAQEEARRRNAPPKEHWLVRSGAAAGTLTGNIFNKYKSGIGESFGRDRTGKKTSDSYIKNLVKLAKDNLQANLKSNKIQNKMYKRLSKWKEYLLMAFSMVGSAVSSMVSSIGGLGGTVLQAIAGFFGFNKVKDWIKSIFKWKKAEPILETGSKIVGKGKGGLLKLGTSLIAGGGMFAGFKNLLDKSKGASEVVTKSTTGKATSVGSKATIEGAESIAKKGGKLGAKAFGKSIVKKLPFVGLMYGLYDGIQRAKEGDFVGAAMSIGSGAAAMGGPAGIGLSLALDAAQFARDSKRKNNAEIEAYITQKKAEEALKKEQETKSVKSSWTSRFMSFFNPQINEKKIKSENPTYENISPDLAKKIKAAQDTAVEFAPLANQFLGGSTIGYLAAQHLNKYATENPNKIVSLADKVVGIGKEAWLAAGNSAKSWDAAKLIHDNKDIYVKTWYDRLGSAKQYAFEQAEAARAKGQSYFEKADKKSGGALSKALNEASSVGSTIYSKGKDVASDIYAHDTTRAAVSFVKSGIVSATDIAKHGASTIMANLYEVMQNLPGSIQTMGQNIGIKFEKAWFFLKDVFGDPVQFYKDTKEKLWGGISKVWLYLGALYEKISGEKIPNFVNTISAASAQLYGNVKNYVGGTAQNFANNVSKARGGRVVERNLAGNKYILRESDFNSSAEFEEASRMNLFKLRKYYPNIVERQMQAQVTGAQIANNTAQNNINMAEMGANALKSGVEGIKTSVDKYSKAAANMVYNVTNSTNSSNSNVVNNGGNRNPNNSRPIDASIQNILVGNI